MKALALLSGGLDSSLAVGLIQKQNIEVLALYFLIPFVKPNLDSSQDSPFSKIAQQLGCKLKVVVLEDEYLSMLGKAPHGYGKNLNPCIDCKILMLKKAKAMLAEEKASFVITGEVLGQRPMSQNKQSLAQIEKESGLEGLLLRPLSARLLPETIPEKEGWVKRENLKDFSGRTRTPQMKLAEELGLTGYSWPGGGCLLTEPLFCNRLKDLIEHNELNIDNIELLKLGRFFRITPFFRLTVARDEKECNALLKLAKKDDFIFEPKELHGPSAIGRGEFTDDIKTICCRIVARYTAKDTEVEVRVKDFSGNYEEVTRVESIAENEFENLMI